MSEDEVKPQSEEPTTEAVKEEDVKGKKEENAVEKSDKEENDKEEAEEDEEMQVDKKEDQEEDEDDDEEEEEEKKEDEEKKKEVVKEKPKPQKKETKAPADEKKTPEKEKVPAVPLYDQPLEMSGKRDRKKVERFIQEEKKEELKFEGRGTALGDIPFIEAMITKMHQDELKTLHRVAYSRPGSGVEIKKNLRKFNGFAFTKDDKKFESKTASTEKIMKSEITKMLQILGLERSGSKGDVVERFLDFMLKPRDIGKKPPKIKKPKTKRRQKKGKDKSKNASTDSISEEDNSEEESSDDEDEDDDEEEEEEEEEKPKKNKKTPAKKTPAKKTPAKKTPAKRPASAKKPAKVSKTVSSDSDSESDDEPLAKKVKQPPTVEIEDITPIRIDASNTDAELHTQRLSEISPKTVSTQTSRKRKLNIDESHINRVSDALTQLQDVSTNRKQEDEYDNFGKHIVSQLRLLPVRNAIILQEKIQTLIAHERLVCLSENSTASLVQSFNEPFDSTISYTDVGPLSDESKFSIESVVSYGEI